MGGIFSTFSNSRRKMQTPRSLEELCQTAVWKTVDGEWSGLEEVALKSAWIRSFLNSPRVSGEDMTIRDIFFFYLATTGLQRSLDSETEVWLLQDIQNIFFSDTDFHIPAIHFTDIHNTVPKIYRLFTLDLKEKEVRVKLKKCLGDLKQDKAVSSGLTPAFSEFIRSRHLHPSSLQQCILSIL